MERGQIQTIVLDAMRLTNLARDANSQLRVDPQAALYGEASPLDSLGLVGLLIDIEENLREQGADLSLSDERAMSASRSPFRDVPSLVRFIEQRLSEVPSAGRDTSS